MNCQYRYDGDCNLGRECPYPLGAVTACPNFKEETFEEDKNRNEKDKHPGHPDSL